VAGRTIFKAVIHFGKVQVPVRLYTAVRDERVHFRLLHDKDQVPLRQQMYCSAENKPVDREDSVKGFEVSEEEYVVLEPEEIESVQLETDRMIDILHFVREEQIDIRYYDRTYYLGPDGEEKAYVLFLRALTETNKVAVGQWAMRGRDYLGAVKASGQIMSLITLRHADEVIPVERLDIEHPKHTKKEMETAKELIKMNTAEFDPAKYQNEYQQQLLHYIEQKAQGKKPKMKRPRRKKPTRPGELQKKLEKSLQKAKRA
jgi:DNA end-binding protein Ku